NRVLVTKAQNKTPYELLLGRTPSIGFIRPFGYPVTILNTLDPLGKFDGNVDEGFLVGYSISSVQEPFDAEKVEEDNVQQYVLFPTKKHDNKTKREAKGKSPVELSTRYRNLSAEFEDFSYNSINEVNATDSLVPAVGQISTNSTNTFSAAGPSNVAVSPTHGKYSYVYTSQYPNDPNMPELEDITYPNNEEDVGVEADFTNLETTIIVSPIPTTRVHKDHHVTQIIGDLSSATQTRSMTRVVKDQDGKSASTPIDTEKPLLKDPDGEDVDVHTYRSMIGSLMYLTSSRPDIMFVVCTLAYTDSDYAGASLDRKSITGGCQFLRCRLISWQCKKKTVVNTSSTKAEGLGSSTIILFPFSLDLVLEFMMIDGVAVSSWSLITTLFLLLAALRAAVIVATVIGVVAAVMVELAAVTTSIISLVVVTTSITSLSSAGSNSSSCMLKTFSACSSVQLSFSGLYMFPVKCGEDPLIFQHHVKVVVVVKVMVVEQLVMEVELIVTAVSLKFLLFGGIIANIVVDEDVTLKDVAAVEKDDEIEENADVQGRQAESQAQIYQIDLEHAEKVLSMQDDELDPAELKEVVEVVTTTKLMIEVVTAASSTITAATTLITVATITAALSAARRRKRVVIRDHEETATPSIIINSKTKSKEKGNGIMVEEPKPLKKQAQIEQDEAYARELEAE
nr:uncharacterized mitochondrial protein AtMg00810-like [Tanacetum cinerariifolium]